MSSSTPLLLPAHATSGRCAPCEAHATASRTRSRRRVSRAERAARLASDSRITIGAAAQRLRISRQAVFVAWRRLFGDRELPSALIRAARNTRIVELCAAGRSAAEIAAEAGVSRDVVQDVLHRQGLRARDPRSLVDRGTLEAALTSIADGASLGEAAAASGISYSYLSILAKARGVKLAMGPRGREDGRLVRAVARVKAGASVAEACRLERCAPPGVYARLGRERRNA
jgi:hypothetical protein